MHNFQYPLSILYRFLIAFGLGYICTSMLSELLTLSFYPHLAKAESIYLAAFLSLYFLYHFCHFELLCSIPEKVKRFNHFAFPLLFSIAEVRKVKPCKICSPINGMATLLAWTNTGMVIICHFFNRCCDLLPS